MAETSLSSITASFWRAACLVGGLLCLWMWILPAHADAPVMQQGTSTKSFDDVIFDLEFAITQRNFRITARNNIGRGIRQRGFKDFPQVIIIQFCNLTYAREALEIDPNFITHMPCRVAVYDHGERIRVSTTSLPENTDEPRVNAFSHKINIMLHNILNFAVGKAPP